MIFTERGASSVLVVILALLYRAFLTIARADSTSSQYTFDSVSVSKILGSSSFIEYMHIPKCGTVSRKICDRGQLPCIPLPRLRKCGFYGEHCDWLAKYTCVQKHARVTFYTLFREPVSRVRSHYNYFYPGACRDGRPTGQPAGQFWTKSMCKNAHNFTAWVLTPDNWVHNRMTRMVHGRMGPGNLCRINPYLEKKFWVSTLNNGRNSFSKQDFTKIPLKINDSQEILEKAKLNLVNHFVLWGDTYELRIFFCILKHLARNKARKLNPLTITKSRKSRPRKELPQEKLLVDEIILQRNTLDKKLYEWAMIPWRSIKVQYESICA